MTVKNAPERPEAQRGQTPARREPTDLDCRYGEIGIEAVAAAARYTGDASKPARGQGPAQIDQRFIEFAY